MTAAIGYIIIVNITAFCLFGVDKSAAIKHKRRIPNKVLLMIAAAGGSAGALLGMLVFRHKTKKWYYRFTVPALLVLHIVLYILLTIRFY